MSAGCARSGVPLMPPLVSLLLRTGGLAPADLQQEVAILGELQHRAARLPAEPHVHLVVDDRCRARYSATGSGSWHLLPGPPTPNSGSAGPPHARSRRPLPSNCITAGAGRQQSASAPCGRGGHPAPGRARLEIRRRALVAGQGPGALDDPDVVMLVHRDAGHLPDQPLVRQRPRPGRIDHVLRGSLRVACTFIWSCQMLKPAATAISAAPQPSSLRLMASPPERKTTSPMFGRARLWCQRQRDQFLSRSRQSFRKSTLFFSATAIHEASAIRSETSLMDAGAGPK